jgi:hypothetical protein
MVGHGDNAQRDGGSHRTNEVRHQDERQRERRKERTANNGAKNIGGAAYGLRHAAGLNKGLGGHDLRYHRLHRGSLERGRCRTGGEKRNHCGDRDAPRAHCQRKRRRHDARGKVRRDADALSVVAVCHDSGRRREDRAG